MIVIVQKETEQVEEKGKKKLTESSKEEGCYGLGDERTKSICLAK